MEENKGGVYNQLRKSKAKFTKEDITKAIEEIYNTAKKQPQERQLIKFDDFPIHYQWEENGKKYSCWKFGGIIMGDGAYAEFCKIFKEELEKTVKLLE